MDTIKKGLVILGASIALGILVYNFQLDAPVRAPEPEDKTLTDDQKRWDRGEFTEEEIEEIRAEEAREDAAVKEIFNQQSN